MRYVSYTRPTPWNCSGGRMTVGEQNETINAYAKEKGWAIVKHYCGQENQDDGESMQQLLCDGMERKYDGVVVASLYYFGSDPYMASRAPFEFFYAAGIHFAVVEDDFDSSMLAAENVKEYFEQKRKESDSNGPRKWRAECEDKEIRKRILHLYVPYGYKLRTDGQSYEKDENVANYVSGIFERYLAGEKPTDIVRWLNGNNVLNRAAYKRERADGVTGRKLTWSTKAVKDILTNEIYTGNCIRKYAGREAEISVEPYISIENYKKILIRLDDEKRIISWSMSKMDNPFSHRIFSEASGLCMQLRKADCLFIDKKYYDNSEETKLGHSIPFDTVMSLVVNQLKEERRRAQLAAQKISDGEGERTLCEEKERLAVQMKAVMKKMKPFLEINLQGEELVQLDGEASDISKKLKEVEKAFRLDNPWIVRYQNAKIPEKLDCRSFQNLVDRVVVANDYSNVKLVLKDLAMKQYLPDEWME